MGLPRRPQQQAKSDGDLRESGIEPVGPLPWGSHICLFFETPDDLLDTHAGYFRSGIERSEMCVWAVSEPITREQAIAALGSRVPDFDSYLERGQIELVSGYEWYLQGDDFAPERITAAWHAKLSEALERGYVGLRVSGNAFWFETELWPSFHEYELALDRSLDGQKMIVLCTYPLQRSRAVDLLEVTRAHQFSIARRNGRWEYLATPQLAAARAEMNDPNDIVGVLSGAFPGQDLLTPRERMMLAQIMIGSTSKEAARAMGISPRTAEFHRANILRKLGARNAAELLGKVLGGQ
jgi:DNA-binding CsgD family transcriptional regulator